MHFILGPLLMLAALALGARQIGFNALLHLESFGFVALFTLGAIFARGGAKAFSKSVRKDPQTFRSLIEVGGLACLLSGLVGTIFGLIHVLENLDAPDKIGPGVALSVISLFYSIVLYAVVFLPHEAQPGLKKTRLALPLAAFLVTMGTAALVLHSIWSYDITHRG